MDLSFFYRTIFPIVISSFGVVSFVWNVHTRSQEGSGFLKLGLECGYKATGDKKYIVSKTVLENTSRKPIMLAHAFLLIVDHSVADSVMKDIVEKTASIGEKEVIDTIHGYLKNHYGDKFIITSLPYYYDIHKRIGSFAHMTKTHIQEVDRNGIYSIYFGVYRVDWYKKKHNPSYARVVHDVVIVE